MTSKVFAIVALSLAAASPAAGQIRFAGSTMGCFGLECSPSQQSALNSLNFVGSNFDVVTGIDGRRTIPLGDFFWDAYTGTATPQEISSPFTLFISFLYPTGIHPEPIYYGDFEGLVIRGKLNGTRVSESSMSLVFEPNVRDYTFTGGIPDQSGDFRLTIRDTYIWPSATSRVYGDISGATVTPEPISMVLLGSGLAGIAAARRRRKQQQAS